MPTKQREVSTRVLGAISVPTHNARHTGSLEVVEKVVEFRPGSFRTFVERRLRFGGRYLALPHTPEDLESLIAALRQGYALADEFYEKLRTSPAPPKESSTCPHPPSNGS
jgi:hypothetical protein